MGERKERRMGGRKSAGARVFTHILASLKYLKSWGPCGAAACQELQGRGWGRKEVGRV